MEVAILVGLLVLVLAFIILGIKKVPLGAKGILISLGRRTGQLREEGILWIVPVIQRIECIFLRERQFRIAKADYHTADRAKLSFDVTLRVTVTDPQRLFDQGPGTYEPFAREGYGGDAGAEEAHVALRTVAQNAIREVVQGLTMDQAMYGGGAGPMLRAEILRALEITCRRWGLSVNDVLVPHIDASSAAMRGAAESEMLETLKGRGQLASHRVVVARGAMFAQIAMDLGAEIQRRTGQAPDLAMIEQFLHQHYQDERALDIAHRAAGHDNLLQQFYVHAFGAPLPRTMSHHALPGSFAGGASGQHRLGGAVQCAACGQTTPSGRFCDTCGAPLSGQAGNGPRGPGAGYARTFVIGREGDFVVNGAGVSRRHATLEDRGGTYVLTDLGSANGTFVQGQRLPPNSSVAVSPGDSVRLGEHVWVQINDVLRC